jgi:hypothetical protein
MVDLPAPARSIEDVELILASMAQKVGHIYGVELSVRQAPDSELVFVDAAGDPVVDNDEAILACNPAEIESGDFLKLFAARSLYAALAQRFIEHER